MSLGVTEKGEQGASAIRSMAERFRIVVCLDRPPAVGEDLVLGLDDAVGRESAVLLGERHRAATRMESNPGPRRPLDVGIEDRASPAREEVAVVGRRRRAGEQELARGDGGRDSRRLLVDALPPLVEEDEPVEQLRVRGARNAAEERLVEMVVRVHEPGKQDLAPAGHDLVGANARRIVADAHDPVPFDEDEAAGDLAPGGVHRHDEIEVAEQRARHPARSTLSATSRNAARRAIADSMSPVWTVSTTEWT